MLVGKPSKNTYIETKLLHADGEDVFALDLEFDAEGRAEIGALSEGAADPDFAGEQRHFGGVEDGAVAGIAYHGVLGAFEVVIVGEAVEVGDEFHLAIAVGSFESESPITAGLRSRAAGKSD